MERGEQIDLAWWCHDGGDSEGEARLTLVQMAEKMFAEIGWTHSPFTVYRVDPPHPRLEPPPLHLQGLNPFAVVLETTAVAPEASAGFGDVWDSAGLERLRRAVRAVWAANHDEVLDNDACDAVIEDMTPEVVRKILN